MKRTAVLGLAGLMVTATVVADNGSGSAAAESRTGSTAAESRTANSAAESRTANSAAEPRTGSTAAEPLGFGPCPDDIAQPYPDMRCAPLDVPLDYAHPHGEQVRLTVSKLPAREPAKRRGSLLVNPGGPGGPGVAFAGRLAGDLPPGVRDTYDLIGFDTRNTAHSTPIHCADPAQYWNHPLPDPNQARNRDWYWQRARGYAQGCQQRAGKYLPHLTTPNNARDMDRIRAALGEERISYLGYSYGTYLGAVYGQLFPRRVDRMILDSAVSPDTSKVWYGNNLGQDVPAQHRLGIFFDWVARYDDVFHLGTTRQQVRTAWDSTRARLSGQPFGELGPYELTDTTFNALYGEKAWMELAQGLSDFHLRGDGRKLAEQVTPADPAEENQNAIYNAVECADAPWPTDRARWERDSRRLEEHAPMAAWFNSWGVAPCASWPAPRQQPTRISGQGLPGVLMFNSVNDVVTPYEGAQEMHRSLPTSVLVTQENAGKHGVFASGGLARNDAANRIGTDYLLRGQLPSGDTSIPGHPLPDPRDPASVRAAQASAGPV